MKPPRFATGLRERDHRDSSPEVTRTVGFFSSTLGMNYGAVVRNGHATAYAFPPAEDLATLHPAHLRQLGFSRQKGRAMIELARSITAEGLDLEETGGAAG